MPGIIDYRPLDPNVATRQQFTDNLANAPIPSDATADWRRAAERLQSVLTKLAAHEAMEPNLQQTYVTPAASKNKVYFIWDFVGRTLGYLYQIPPGADLGEEGVKEKWSDIVGRNVMAGGLIIDDKPGFLDQLVESTYPDSAGTHPEFGEEILEEGRKLFRNE